MYCGSGKKKLVRIRQRKQTLVIERYPPFASDQEMEESQGSTSNQNESFLLTQENPSASEGWYHQSTRLGKLYQIQNSWRYWRIALWWGTDWECFCPQSHKYTSWELANTHPGQPFSCSMSSLPASDKGALSTGADKIDFQLQLHSHQCLEDEAPNRN